MRVHLQDRKNRLYYAGQDFPLGGSEGAMNFASVGAAAKVALEKQLTQMQIVVRYAVAPCEISLPVLAEWSNFERKTDPRPSRAAKSATAELQFADMKPHQNTRTFPREQHESFSQTKTAAR